jgi:hypothetical protein
MDIFDFNLFVEKIMKKNSYMIQLKNVIFFKKKFPLQTKTTNVFVLCTIFYNTANFIRMKKNILLLRFALTGQ